MSKFKQLINIHSHSHYSLDGAATVDQIVKRNKDLGATHACLTEHGNLNSAIELYDSAKKHGLKPIIGIELYLEPLFKDELRTMIVSSFANPKALKGVELEEAIDKELHKHYTHLTVHFKDEWAYQYFCRLTPIMEDRAIVKWGERKPICTIEELAAATGHITICSGCLISAVNKWLDPMKNKSVIRYDLAEKAYQVIRYIAGEGNFFVEVFPHNITHNWKRAKVDSKTKKILEPGHFEEIGCSDLAPEGDIQKAANKFIVHLAQKYKDPIVISLDSHYATMNQKLIQDARLGNGMENWRFHEHLHIMSTDEAAESLKTDLGVDDKTIEEWVDNSYKLASLFDNFKMTTSKDRWVLDQVPDDFMRKLIISIQSHGRMDWQNPDMVTRLKYEIDVLANNGTINLLPYFFTLEEIAEYCRQNDILMNVRGSAGGSLLLYTLGVSAINPLKHNLSFERFLTLGRIKARTLPDADVDLPTGDRDRVIEYLEGKYGDRICRISTDIQLKIKSSLKDADRAINSTVSKETEKICARMPKNMNNLPETDFVFGYNDDDGVYHQGVLETYEPLKKYIEMNPKVWEATKEMLGINRQKSLHACGYVIADKPIQEYCPIIRVGNVKATGFSPKSVEKAGLVKYDFLGLNTLKDIQECLKLIKSRKGITIDPWTLPQEKEVYELFHSGETESVFQFDTDVVRPYLMSIKPNDLDDLAIITALARPGTLDAPSDDGRTLAAVYVSRAQGKEETKYIHPDMKPALEKTHGINIFQEQTIRLFRDLGGYTAEEAETIRRGIGKKDAKVVAEATRGLKARCLKTGWTEDQVNLLVEQIKASQRYSFNQSHATSYAYVAYACMYLKHHYPVEWWTIVLSNSDKDDLQKYWPHMSDIILMPDINNSTDKFEIINDNGSEKIRAPLNLIDGVGNASIQNIIATRPYKDITDLVTRVNRQVIRKDVVYSLILSGAMDSLFSKDYDYQHKIMEYEKAKAIVAGKKSPDPIPQWLQSLNNIQRFLLKKKVFKVYSEDLYPVVLEKLVQTNLVKLLKVVGGSNIYAYNDPNSYNLNNSRLVGHRYFTTFILNNEDKDDTPFGIVGYIIDTKEKTYRAAETMGSSNMVDKRMMNITFELGAGIYSAIKWPEWKSTSHGIDKDIKDSICFIVMQKKKKGDLIIKKIIPIDKLNI